MVKVKNRRIQCLIASSKYIKLMKRAPKNKICIRNRESRWSIKKEPKKANGKQTKYTNILLSFSFWTPKITSKKAKCNYLDDSECLRCLRQWLFLLAQETCYNAGLFIKKWSENMVASRLFFGKVWRRLRDYNMLSFNHKKEVKLKFYGKRAFQTLEKIKDSKN